MDDITKAISDLEKQIAEMSSESSTSDDASEEEEVPQPKDSDPVADFPGASIITINEDEAKAIRKQEITQQVLDVDKKLSVENHISDEEIDLENLDLEWRYSIPTAK